jgi:UDP-galactopyranose mutase
MLEDVECKTNVDFFNSEYKDWQNYADKLVYTGAIDEYLNISLEN